MDPFALTEISSVQAEQYNSFTYESKIMPLRRLCMCREQ